MQAGWWAGGPHRGGSDSIEEGSEAGLLCGFHDRHTLHTTIVLPLKLSFRVHSSDLQLVSLAMGIQDW